MLVSVTAPAAGGEVLEIFATGLGPVSNTQADGVATPVNTLSSDQIIPRVIISGVDAKVLFAGLAPGFVGLYQMNVVVPSNLASGPATVVIAVGPLFGNPVILQLH